MHGITHAVNCLVDVFSPFWISNTNLPHPLLCKCLTWALLTGIPQRQSSPGLYIVLYFSSFSLQSTITAWAGSGRGSQEVKRKPYWILHLGLVCGWIVSSQPPPPTRHTHKIFMFLWNLGMCPYLEIVFKDVIS